MFNRGDKVVCVDTLGPTTLSWEPKLGGVYTVVDVFGCRPEEADQFADEDEPCLVLTEDPQPVDDDGDGWPARMFRKLTRADAEFTATIRACRPREVEVA